MFFFSPFLTVFIVFSFVFDAIDHFWPYITHIQEGQVLDLCGIFPTIIRLLRVSIISQVSLKPIPVYCSIFVPSPLSTPTSPMSPVSPFFLASRDRLHNAREIPNIYSFYCSSQHITPNFYFTKMEHLR